VFDALVWDDFGYAWGLSHPLFGRQLRIEGPVVGHASREGVEDGLIGDEPGEVDVVAGGHALAIFKGAGQHDFVVPHDDIKGQVPGLLSGHEGQV
jgi:hypothetical protein